LRPAFEGYGGIILALALAFGRVVVVPPIVATTPRWNLVIAIIFLRDGEEINTRTTAGKVCVVIGTVAIAIGR